jgi:hypothetical protein
VQYTSHAAVVDQPTCQRDAKLMVQSVAVHAAVEHELGARGVLQCPTHAACHALCAASVSLLPPRGVERREGGQRTSRMDLRPATPLSGSPVNTTLPSACTSNRK